MSIYPEIYLLVKDRMCWLFEKMASICSQIMADLSLLFSRCILDFLKGVGKNAIMFECS